VTRATIVLIEVGSCVRALWTRPKPTTSVTQASASITTLKCLTRLAASSEMFMNAPPETSLSLVAASRQKVQWWRPYNRGDNDALAFRPIAARQILKTSLRFSRAEIFGFLVPSSRHRDVGQGIASAQFCKLDRIIGRAKLQGRCRVASLHCLLQHQLR